MTPPREGERLASKPLIGRNVVIDQGNRQRTGRATTRLCVVERAKTLHHEEDSGLWRCGSCGHAQGEDLRDIGAPRKEAPNG